MYKKITAALLAVILLFSCSICAFADAGGPVFKEFTYTVEDPDGIDLYESRWENEQSVMYYYTTAPQGTVLTILGEYSHDGKVYGGVEYGGIYLYLDTANVHLNGEFIYPTEEDKYYQAINVIVIKPDGTTLHNGPSHAYDKSVTVPYGATFTTEYATDEWAYVEYNGTKGWLYYYQYENGYTCADILEKTNKLMVVQNGTNIFETPDTKSKVMAADIPYGTVLTYKYAYSLFKGIMAYVEYNGIKGWVETSSSFAKGAAAHYDKLITIKDKAGIEIYDKAFDTSNVIGHIPYNTLLKADFSICNEYDEEPLNWDYIEYEGKKGWIATDYDQTICTWNTLSIYKAKSESVPVYAEQDASSTQLYEIAAGDSFTTYANEYKYDDESWYLVGNEDYYGWICKTDDIEYVEEIEIDPSVIRISPIGVKLEPAPIVEEPTEEVTEAPTINEDKKDKDKDKSDSDKLNVPPNGIIIVCVASAAIIAAAAVAIILVVKKGKKQ